MTQYPKPCDSRPALAVQQLYVHLGRQGGGVKLLDHLYRRAGIAGKRQQIDVAAKDQTKGNSGVAQTVKAAVCAVWPLFQAQLIHDPVEQPANGVQGAQAVFFFGKKHIVFRSAKA